MAKNKQGMTLVEILFAFAIITTVLTLAYGSALSAWRSASAANQRTQAQYLAQQGLESIRAYRESDGFSWNSFINALPPTAGGVFHMELDQSAGPNTTDSYVCSFPPCSFVVATSPVGLRAIGTNLAIPNVSDNTDYTLTITPESYFTTGVVNAIAGSPRNAPNPNLVTAITFTARVTWTSATGTPNSNVVASTIITELD